MRMRESGWNCMCRAVVMWLGSVIYRFRYYFAWAVSESALIFSGFCFNGWTDEAAAPRPGSSGKTGACAQASLPVHTDVNCYSPHTSCQGLGTCVCGVSLAF